MAVTTATYTATATWTASQLANIFRSAFIDAGLMTEWHDSFLNTVENRVLEVQYDNTKTYGKTYYWFMFTTSGVFVSLASGWNATTHVPTGTQYLDYFATTTNATTNHGTFLSGLSASTTVTITRYSSAITSGFAFFLIRNGTTNKTLHIARASAPRPSWIDLDKSFFHYWADVRPSTSNLGGTIGLVQLPAVMRRSYLGGAGLRGQTNVAGFTGSQNLIESSAPGLYYGAFGNASASALTNRSILQQAVMLPTNFNNTNTSYSTDNVPIFTGLPYCGYINEVLPADFGITFHYANNTMAVADTFTVSAGTEVWDVLAVSNNATITTGASPMFLARTT
jgi:hypothetical protein